MEREVKKVTAEERAALERLSAATLPDSPTQSGMKPAMIRAAFWQALTKGRGSVAGLIDRVVGEMNDALSNSIGREELGILMDEVASALYTLEGVRVQAVMTSQEPRVEVDRTEGEGGDDITVTFYLPKGDQGERGRGLEIAKSYRTLDEMHADVDNEQIAVGELVIIDTSPDMNKEENAAVYIKTQNEDGSFAYKFFVDLSGAVGIKGERGRDGVFAASCLPTAEDFTGTPESDPSYKFKVCTYDRNEPHLAADLDFRVIVGGYGFRFPFNVQYPFSGSMRTMFVKPRIIFESEANKGSVTHVRLYEKPGTDTSHRELWLEIKTKNTAQRISAIYLDADAHSNGFGDFVLMPMPYEAWQSVSGYDSTTVYTADWANKTAVLSLDSRATAEGATVGGTDNRVEATDAASFGNGGTITDSGVASLQSGTGNTNRSHDAIQGGADNENSGPMSLQVGNGNNNTATDTVQAGCRNYNSVADVIQAGSDNTNTGSDTIQGGTGNTNSGTNCVQSGTGNTNNGNRVLQVGNGNTNDANDSLQSGIKQYNGGTDSVQFGHTQTNYGQHCHQHGYENHNDRTGDKRCDYVDMHGTRLNATRRLQMLRGQWSKDDERALAIWANGTSDSDRKNVLTVSASGTAENATDAVSLGNLLDLFCETVITLNCNAYSQLNDVTGKLTVGDSYVINNVRFTAVRVQGGVSPNTWDYAAPPVGTRFWCEEIGSECRVISHDPNGFVIKPVKESYVNTTVCVKIRKLLGGAGDVTSALAAMEQAILEGEW